MINITTKSGKRLGRISDDMGQDDIIYIDGKPQNLSDVYNSPELMQKFKDEVKGLNDGKTKED